jgi:hypothetical protein
MSDLLTSLIPLRSFSGPFYRYKHWFEVRGSTSASQDSHLCFTQIITDDLTSARKGVLGVNGTTHEGQSSESTSQLTSESNEMQGTSQTGFRLPYSEARQSLSRDAR